MTRQSAPADARRPPGAGAPPGAGSARRWRDLLVWLHVITSVGWLGQTLTLFALIIFGRMAIDPGGRDAAGSIAHLIDRWVLAQLANASAFTGFMLSALTPWGYFRSWWVLTKAAITVTQLTLGVFVLSADPTAGNLPVVLMMTCALAFQAWLSVAKPWRRTPWADRPGGPRRLPTGSPRMFAWSVLVPWIDLGLSLRLGHPSPLVSLTTVIGYAVLRARRISRGRVPAPT